MSGVLKESTNEVQSRWVFRRHSSAKVSDNVVSLKNAFTTRKNLNVRAICREQRHVWAI